MLSGIQSMNSMWGRRRWKHPPLYLWSYLCSQLQLRHPMEWLLLLLLLSRSVVSDSVRPHRQQPTRLLSPWDSPGKYTGVGCHFLLQCMKVQSESEVTQSCLTLRNPMDCSPPGSSVHGIFQARVLEWGAIAFSNRVNSRVATHIFVRWIQRCVKNKV